MLAQARFRFVGRSVLTTLLLFVEMVVCSQMFAQVAGGTLSGTIIDPSGAAVPQAQVTIRNVATGVERAVSTNADGFYTVPNLQPGSYEITVTAKGFSTETQRGLTMRSVRSKQSTDDAGWQYRQPRRGDQRSPSR